LTRQRSFPSESRETRLPLLTASARFPSGSTSGGPEKPDGSLNSSRLKGEMKVPNSGSVVAPGCGVGTWMLAAVAGGGLAGCFRGGLLGRDVQVGIVRQNTAGNGGNQKD
jgi:hypothetical protein